MRVVPELVNIVKQKATGGPDPRGKIGTTRVDFKHIEQKTFEAAYKTEDKKFDILIDEPEVRGGMSRGATPLGYFVTGAGG
jgi:hypothetical protein